MKRQVTYVLMDAGRIKGIARTDAGRHGERVEYGARRPDGPLDVYGTALLILPSQLGNSSGARVTRRDVRRTLDGKDASFHAWDVA